MGRLARTLLAIAAPATIALGAGPAHAAFGITQAAGANYDPVEGPIACGLGFCTTSSCPFGCWTSAL